MPQRGKYQTWRIGVKALSFEMLDLLTQHRDITRQIKALHDQKTEIERKIKALESPDPADDLAEQSERRGVV